MVRIKVPETIVKEMARMADGRRYNDVEIAVDSEGFAIRIERTGEMIEWSRQAYEAEKNKIEVKRGKL